MGILSSVIPGNINDEQHHTLPRQSVAIDLLTLPAFNMRSTSLCRKISRKKIKIKEPSDYRVLVVGIAGLTRLAVVNLNCAGGSRFDSRELINPLTRFCNVRTMQITHQLLSAFFFFFFTTRKISRPMGTCKNEREPRVISGQLWYLMAKKIETQVCIVT